MRMPISRLLPIWKQNIARMYSTTWGQRPQRTVNLNKHQRGNDTIRFNSNKQIIASTDSSVKCLGVFQREIIRIPQYYETRNVESLYESHRICMTLAVSAHMH